MNQSLDTLLENALKIADTPLLNDDARKAMITNYEKDYLSYAQDFNVFRNLMRQTNQLNSSMLTVYFQNRYGYSFEYNVKTAQQRHTIESNMEKWKKIAETSKNRTYFAPLQTDSSTGHSILPMVKILLDRYDYQETGLCYAEIDFTPIMEILSSSCETQNTLLIYNADNKLTCTINLASFSEADISSSVLSKLEDFSNTLTSQDAIGQSTLKTSLGQFVINGCINNTTQWHIVQIISNEKIAHTFHDTIISYLGIFLFCALLGLILAIFLSRILTRPVSNLCHEIDILDPSDGTQIDLKSCGSNQELRKLIDSFNGMSQRLFLSLKQNYEIQITEQQMRVQMLQFQINHHFLHNTLNVIKSLAEIHDVPEIETIATCMSELVRYNLEKFPVATLQEELQQVQRYMTIQNIRFPGKFCYDINVPPEFLQMNLPVFLFQPLVENSVEHGFSNKETRDIFQILLSVSGVGAKMAIALLNEFDACDLISLVIDGNFKELTRAKGVGPKLAQKIILELKDKLMKTELPRTSCKLPKSQAFDDTQAVLLSLGYEENEIEDVLEKIMPTIQDHSNSEEVIRKALTCLSM